MRSIIEGGLARGNRKRTAETACQPRLRYTKGFAHVPGDAERIAALNLIPILVSQSAFVATTRSMDPKSFFLALVVVGMIVAVSVALDKIRSGKIEALARSLGLTYRLKPTEADEALPIGCHLANLGHRKVVSNILEATTTPELAFTIFDYSYTIGSGRSSTTYSQTISRMQSSLLQLPSFILFPETFFSKLGDRWATQKDINFADTPVFSETFILRGEDEAAIRALFTLTLRKALEKFTYLSIEGMGDHVFLFRNNRRLKPEQFSPTIEENKRILALFFEAQQSQAG